MRRLLQLCGVVGMLGMVGGCSVYVDGYRYVPRPGVAEVRAATTEPAGVPVTVLATVIGVRREDKKEGIPASVEVRLRVEASGGETVTFDPQTLELSTGTLMGFGRVMVRPAGAVSLGANQSAEFSAYFPFAGGRSWDNTDMSTLQMRWLVVIHGQTVRQVTDFHMVVPVYYYYGEPYGYPYGYGAGFYYGYYGEGRRWRR